MVALINQLSRTGTPDAEINLDPPRDPLKLTFNLNYKVTTFSKKTMKRVEQSHPRLLIPFP